MRHLPLVTALLLGLSPLGLPLAAQDPRPPETRQDPRAMRLGTVPRGVSVEAVRLFNARDTRRVRGDITLAETDTVRGNLAVLRGRALVRGTILGQLLVINGDAVLAGSARIDGNLTVLGGHFESPDQPVVRGDIAVWSARLSVVESGDTLVANGEVERVARWTRWEREDPNGSDGSLFFTSAHSYNRAEGLPVWAGPRLRVRNGDTGLLAEAYGIFRTGSQLAWNRENLGHRLRVELREGRKAGLLIGGRLYDEVDAVEHWQLSDTEVGLASFLFTRDYRDYWLRHGGEASIGLFGPGATEVRATVAHERWSSRRTLDVPSLIDANAPWRRNPQVDAGVMHLLTVSGTLDTRDQPEDPRSGWLLRGSLERGKGVLDSIAPTTPDVRDVTPGPIAYARFFVDLRRYTRLGPNLQVNLRAVGGGRLGANALPMQRRLSVSGIDALPGFDFRRAPTAIDVGTCATGSVEAYSALGRPAQCERIALLQAELKRDFRIDLTGGADGLGDRRWFPGLRRADGAIVLFANAGRGWLVGTPTDALHLQAGAFPTMRHWNADVGAGLDFGSVGFYVAQAVSQSTLKPNLYLRLGHRF